jgi:HlyD family secretion protein
MKLNLRRIIPMHTERRRVIPIGLVIVALVAISIWLFGIRPYQHADPLTASGTMAITQVQIGAELGGHVVAVNVDEGDLVLVGEELVQLDATLLQAQRAQAQASYDLLVSGGSPEQRSARIAAAELQLLMAQQNLQDLYDNAALKSAEAQKKLAEARDALKDANYYLTVRQEGNRASANTIDAAEANLILANEEVDVAEQRYDHAHGEASKALALSNLAAAKQKRDSIQRNLNWYYGAPTEIEQAMLEADVAIAEANVAIAEDEYNAVQSGPDPDQLALYEAAVANAQAQYDLATGDPGKEELAIAQAAVDLLDVQIGKMTITAPSDGVILTRVIQPGENVLPGSTLLVLGIVDKMTITVYVPENRYGEISIGQKASVSVDSFPGVNFEAVVTAIADQAEFTPRNVQTVEGRKNTVFAIHLRITPDVRLKPGMPADVIFQLDDSK